MSGARLVGLTVIFEGALLALAVVLGAVFDAPALDRLRPDWGDLLLGAILGASLIGGLLLALRAPWPVLDALRRDLVGPVAGLFAGQTAWGLALVSLMAGICEEAFFRGFLQDAVEARLGPWAALSVASLLFGLAHAISPAYALYAGLAGAVLGAVYIASGNLLLPATAHAVFDFLGLLWLTRSGGDAGHGAGSAEPRGLPVA